MSVFLEIKKNGHSLYLHEILKKKLYEPATDELECSPIFLWFLSTRSFFQFPSESDS